MSSKSLFPQSCESSVIKSHCSPRSSSLRVLICLVALWWGWWQPPPRGLMPHAPWPRSAAVRVPVPAAGHCWPVPPQETLKHSKAGLVQSLWGLWVLVCRRFCLNPPSISAWYGVWFSMWFCPSYHLVGAFPLPLDVRYLSLVGSSILLLMVVQQGVAILEFLQKMSTHPFNRPSWIDPWSMGPRYDQWNLNTISNFILTIPTIIKKKKTA